MDQGLFGLLYSDHEHGHLQVTEMLPAVCGVAASAAATAAKRDTIEERRENRVEMSKKEGKEKSEERKETRDERRPPGENGVQVFSLSFHKFLTACLFQRSHL